MVAAEEAPDRVGTQARLEGLLGVPEGHHAPLLPVRLEGGPFRRGSAKAFNHCRRSNHATHSGASQARLHLLPEHGIRRRLPVPGTMSGEMRGDGTVSVYANAGTDYYLLLLG